MDALLAAPYSNIICMLAVSIVMVTLLSLCACKSNEPREEDVEGNEAVEKGSGKKQNRGSVKQKNDAVADTDVVIETVTAGQEVEAAGDKPANGRPLSHDRALPDLPLARVPVNDEIEEDGHYNVVAKGRIVVQANGAVAQAPNRIYDEVGDCAGDGAKKSEENTDYAEVNDRSDDPCHAPFVPMYSGIMEGQTTEKCDSTRTKGGPVPRKDRHPYEAVDGIGNPGFMDFGDNGNSNGNDGVCRTQSMNTLESTLSVVAPPVPDKNFTESEDSSLVTPSGGNKSSSPSLPPRNGTDSVVGVGSLVCASTTDVSGDAIGCVATSPTGKKKEPPYSCVTAREPLENLLRRQAEQSAMTESFDPNYASVDYDQIKQPVVSNMANQSADRNSLSSGFYAEIPSGDSSSLTYAKVGGGELRNHAPTPPPLDTLKHLSLPPGVSTEDDVPDPGYSSIVRKKSQPRDTAAVTSQAPVSPAENAAGAQSPMYAVVNKRRTIHAEAGPESHPDDLYAQVVKPKKNGNPTNGARPKVTSNETVKSDGVPKTTTRSGITEAKRAFFSTPGYQTIGDHLPSQTGLPPNATHKVSRGSDPEPPYDDIRSSQILDPSSVNANYESVDMNNGDTGTRVVLVSNPDYESVDGNNDLRKNRKSGISLVDPNYESVDLVFEDSKVKVALVESSAEPDYEVVPPTEGTEEMATPMTAAGGSTAAVGNSTSKQWQRREPIYSEIDEEMKGKEGKKKKKNEKASK